jgi:biotin transporter BioY
MIGNVLAAANVLLACITGVFSLRWYLRNSSRRSFRWVKLLFALISFYWCGLYIFVLIAEPGTYNAVWFGQTFVRPAFTFTLGIMASAAVQRYRSGTK